MTARAVPILKVADGAAAEVFYREVLGAEVLAHYAAGADPDPAYLSLDLMAAELHLSSFPLDGVSGQAVYLYVEDVDAVAERVRKAAPHALTTGPIDQDWGMRECFVTDPDGNKLRFGQALG